MSDDVTLTIDDHSVTVPAGMTILKAAETLGEHIPTIFFHAACTSNGLCRMCVVEVEGARVLSPAWVAQVGEGMVVPPRSARVERSRRTILEVLESAVDLSEAPEIQIMLEDYAADQERFPGAGPRAVPLLDDNPMYVRDYAKCVLSWRCVQVCAEDAQYTYALNFTGRGFHTSIGTFFDKAMPQTTCVFCGQCVGVCPTGARKGEREYLLEQGVAPEAIFQQTRAPRRAGRRGMGDEDVAG